MKNYNRTRRKHYIFIVSSLAVFAAMMFVLGKSDFTVANTAIIFVTAALTAVLLVATSYELSLIPNGRPRPEDELPRRKLFGVYSRTDNHLLLWNVPSPDGEKPVYWKFEDLPIEVEPGKTIVYLKEKSEEYQPGGTIDLDRIARGREKNKPATC